MNDNGSGTQIDPFLMVACVIILLWFFGGIAANRPAPVNPSGLSVEQTRTAGQ